jgi:hypothetical protein
MYRKRYTRIRERLMRYVARRTIESRLQRYTSGHRRLARQATVRVRLARYVARI